jgi:hypothetical protein
MSKKPIGGRVFSTVKKARLALKAQANDSYALLVNIIKQAAASGDFETAAKYTAWLLEHTPDEDGERLLDISIDKPQQVERAAGPQIQIGFALGGVPQTQAKALPVIDVTTDDDDTK